MKIKLFKLQMYGRTRSRRYAQLPPKPTYQ